jgi:tRNA threonylcarbamoyl adenosine modification protein (Sua5/YciO/YrdC/YwlC family)
MHVFHSINEPEVVRLLQNGHIGVMPTDTVYGIVASAHDPAAVGRLYKAKHREGKPGTLIAADVDQLIKLGIAPAPLRRIAHLWPDSLSVIVPSSPLLAYLDQGKGSLAVRVPKDAAIRQLLQRTGPLLTSSANQPGQPPATDTAAAQEYFGETVDFYVGGGDSKDMLPSTIVRVTDAGDIQVLRYGAVTIKP